MQVSVLDFGDSNTCGIKQHKFEVINFNELCEKVRDYSDAYATVYGEENGAYMVRIHDRRIYTIGKKVKMRAEKSEFGWAWKEVA